MAVVSGVSSMRLPMTSVAQQVALLLSSLWAGPRRNICCIDHDLRGESNSWHACTIEEDRAIDRLQNDTPGTQIFKGTPGVKRRRRSLLNGGLGSKYHAARVFHGRWTANGWGLITSCYWTHGFFALQSISWVFTRRDTTPRYLHRNLGKTLTITTGLQNQLSWALCIKSRVLPSDWWGKYTRIIIMPSFFPYFIMYRCNMILVSFPPKSDSRIIRLGMYSHQVIYWFL